MRARVQQEEALLASMASFYATIPIPLARRRGNNEIEPPRDSWLSRLWRNIKMGLLLFAGIVGIFEVAIWTFIGSQNTLIQIMPGIHLAALIPFCAACSVIAMAQFIGFEVEQIKRLFGVSTRSDEVKLLETLEKQVKLAKKINDTLSDHTVFSPLEVKEYAEYVKQAAKYNDKINTEQQAFVVYQESKVKRVLRHLMNGFGLLLALIDSYFSSTLLVNLFAPALVGTVAGWSIITLIPAATAIFYLAMSGSALNAMFNPVQSLSKRVKEKLDKFVLRDNAYFTRLLEIKRQFQAIPNSDNVISINVKAVGRNRAQSLDLAIRHNERPGR